MLVALCAVAIVGAKMAQDTFLEHSLLAPAAGAGVCDVALPTAFYGTHLDNRQAMMVNRNEPLCVVS